MIINITWVHKEEHNFTVIQQYQVFLVDLESYSIGNFGLDISAYRAYRNFRITYCAR